MKANLLTSIKIQKRVIFALLMREILTRYGRHNLGFLWLFLEPALFTIGIVILWSFVKIHSSEISIVAFAVTGYSYVLMWRNVASRTAKAIEPNLSLMYHKNVKVLDIFFARIILEVSGNTISFVLLSIIFISLNLMPLPHDIFLMIIAWILLTLFSIGLGLIIGVISEVSEVFDRIWHTLTYLFFPLSGAVFFVDSLPKNIQEIALYIPPIHAIEMLRNGYFGDLVTTHEQPLYLLNCSLIMILIGLLATKWLSNKVVPE